MAGGVCIAGGMCGRGVCMVGGMHGRGVCVTGGHACPPARYYEIRSISGMECILVNNENICWR